MRLFKSIFALLATIPFALFTAAETTPLSEGDAAPDWQLPASDGNTYSLSELLEESSVVVAWFPKAYTPGCTAECKSMAKNGDLIREFNVRYFMASVDKVEDNTGFAEQNNADFPILSDVSKETAAAYGVMSNWGFPKRYTYYIGQDGTVLKIDKDVNPETAAEDIASTLADLGIAKVETSSETESES